MTLYKQWIKLMEDQTEETFEDVYMSIFFPTKMNILPAALTNWLKSLTPIPLYSWDFWTA